MKEMLEELQTMLKPDFDWRKHCPECCCSDEDEDEKEYDIGIFQETLDGKFRKCYALREGVLQSYLSQCGSIGLPDTPKSLYRALYLFEPNDVDFSDMYKSKILNVVSPHGDYAARLYLFKYELSLYFYCRERLITKTKDDHGIRCNIPGADNSLACSGPVGNLWFEVLVAALNREWDVYCGNDFMV